MSLMPTLAILGHELWGLGASWLVRLWLLGSALATFLMLAGDWTVVMSAPLIARLLFSFLVFPWFFVVIVLGISPVTGSRLDALADGILSRPVTRFEYLFACWAARVAVVLGVFLAVALPAAAIIYLAARKGVPQDSVTPYGIMLSLLLVSLVLVFLVTLAFFTGTVLRKPMLAAVVLVFAWFPINIVLHEFQLEEFSPISLSQALPDVLRTPWGGDQGTDGGLSRADAEAIARLGKFVAELTVGAPAPREESFFDKGDYRDFSLPRVVLGYGVPTLILFGLATACFARRDL
ncbi:MAG: hypothetical protein FJ276_16605 [Planctomycetes bacterium]|nr:hypothetical protein [Planctomycetota bacterium]